MKMRFYSVIFFVALIAGTAFMSGCGMSYLEGGGGTATGNPGVDDLPNPTDPLDPGDDGDLGGDNPGGPVGVDIPLDTDPDDSEEDETEAERIIIGSQAILSHMCDKLEECNEGLEPDTCTNGFLMISNIDTELGLNYSVSSYQHIIDNDRKGVFKVSREALIQCLADIDVMGCDDPLVQGAYDKNAPQDFSNVYRMIPDLEGSCPDVMTGLLPSMQAPVLDKELSTQLPTLPSFEVNAFDPHTPSDRFHN